MADDVYAAANFWLNLRLPPRWFRRLARVVPRRYRRHLVGLWLWWDADG